ncbi:MAG: peroxiredoxin [Candidatus Dactylopiibacterium carminicum]|uniref:thioredoxin-dependent peroxiredoxin n=1 Tax=Candidatus Dactylopiibacterium carminicum TaxID=857335 RepID=A0A272ESS2_9RHOO|nr:peroxiredoxin [Candidatus Dactylopiibacterium carminicum]KAF7599063.1 peroxiredoxin [Candidatus Dactylopiibacterium carminicum]PAS93086.1 MAG: peroxiredoxin [Candidatus Dactylopiibacterium carminicum]PAS99075.1 MAG: peroxiredoxin [Candidatus Dactylopiibacterium carminicum]
MSDSLPDLTLEATSGQHINLAELGGGKVVLYFYPKDNTPGCTTEGIDFARLHAEFAAAGARVFGVSRDSVKSHENFKCKFDFPFELLSDADESLCDTFGVIKLKNMYGKQVRGIERSTFVFAVGGKLAREWRKVKVDGHALEVLEYVKSL